MNEQNLSRFAIILLALVMAVFGVYHFIYPGNLIGYLPLYRPKRDLWVYLPGAAYILAAIAFITNKKVKLAAYLLAALLIISVLAIHLPAFLNAGDADVRREEFINLLKDIAIAAFALHIAANSPN